MIAAEHAIALLSEIPQIACDPATLGTMRVL
jgi:hypothetical protein